MELIETLHGAQGGETLSKMAARAGVEPEAMQAVVDAVVPELAFQIERNTLSRGGLADLVAALGSGHHDAYLDDGDLAGSDAAREDGNAILGHIVGTKHASRVMAARAARESGVAPEIVESVLPEIAAVTMGGLSRQTASQFGDIFSRFPGQSSGSGRPMPDQRPLPLPGESPGGGWADEWSSGNTPGGDVFPRQEQRDGQVPTGGGGGFDQQSPLPVPGEVPGGNWGGGAPRRGSRPGYDDLSDVIRRRGGRIEGGSIWSMVREIIASTLGFRNTGVVSWILRFILIRVAWPILKRLLFGR